MSGDELRLAFPPFTCTDCLSDLLLEHYGHRLEHLILISQGSKENMYRLCILGRNNWIGLIELSRRAHSCAICIRDSTSSLRWAPA